MFRDVMPRELSAQLNDETNTGPNRLGLAAKHEMRLPTSLPIREITQHPEADRVGPRLHTFAEYAANQQQRRDHQMTTRRWPRNAIGAENYFRSSVSINGGELARLAIGPHMSKPLSS